MKNYLPGKNIRRRCAAGVALALSATLALPIAPAANAAVEVTSAAELRAASPDTKQLAQAHELGALLEAIDAIPESVLQQGERATQQWLVDRLSAGSKQGTTTGLSIAVPAANFWGCSAAVATVVASTAFPLAKILKIKKLMNALGGGAEAIKVIWGASFSYEKMQALGGAAAALAGELIGITAIREGCFS